MLLFISKASEMASRIIPSPTPILNSSVIVLVIYLASVPEAEDNNSKIIEIFLLVELLPEIVANFFKLLKTNLILRGCEKKVVWLFLEYNFSAAAPISPWSLI